jgi:hypothetical protein
VWYDIGNSTHNGYDVPAEIRALGRERICAFHIKDRGYLGEGKVDVPAALKAIDDIGFVGDAMLETGSPSGDAEADTRRNFEYLRKLKKSYQPRQCGWGSIDTRPRPQDTGLIQQLRTGRQQKHGMSRASKLSRPLCVELQCYVSPSSPSSGRRSPRTKI